MHLFNSKRSCYFVAFMVIYVFYNPTDSEALEITSSNINTTIASHELVLLNFYTEWCHFSQILSPIFNEAANEVKALLPLAGKVILAKVNCDKQSTIAQQYRITKYPTLKLIRNGEVLANEYRGQRSAKALVQYIHKQLEDQIKEFQSLKDLEKLDPKKRIIIGYFDHRDQTEYNVFRKVATNLKEKCQFHVGFGEAAQAMHPPGSPIIVFRPDVALSHENDETFTGDIQNFNDMKKWIHTKCVPLVREITFENAEELTEEGLPFLILFHHPNDTESIKDFKAAIQDQLMHHKETVNFLTADGKRFAHPLHHLGKSEDDLPLIAIDSFKHMYLFRNFKDIYSHGRLEQFLLDLHSGKLHREYHYGPDPTANDVQTEVVMKIDDNQQPKPHDSQFKNLGPSKHRYTLLKDEL